MVNPDPVAGFQFNLEPKGFILVSGDDRAQPMLAYSFESSFFIDNVPSNVSWMMDAYKKMVYHYADTEQKEKELSAYNEMLTLFPDDPSALNSYAWRMAEIDRNLEDALLKVQKAINLSDDDPSSQANIIDTKAEVLWKLGHLDEAIKYIEQAIYLDSNNEYYKLQKNKFLDTAKK